jgi:hypothetical protein
MAWADVNFAEYYHRYFNHDLTFAVRDGKITYASLAGARVPERRWAPCRPTAGILIDAALAKAVAAHAKAKFSLDGASTAAGLIRSGDEVYLVVAADVIAESATAGREP